MQSYLTSSTEVRILKSKNKSGYQRRDTLEITPSSALDRYMLMILQTPPFPNGHLVEEPDDLSCNVLASCLLVVHDASGSCEDNVSELTGRKELDDPLLEIGKADVVSGGDDTSLVEANKSS